MSPPASPGVHRGVDEGGAHRLPGAGVQALDHRQLRPARQQHAAHETARRGVVLEGVPGQLNHEMAGELGGGGGVQQDHVLAGIHAQLELVPGC